MLDGIAHAFDSEDARRPAVLAVARAHRDAGLAAGDGDCSVAAGCDAFKAHVGECFSDYVEPRARQLIAFYKGLERLAGAAAAD